MTSVTPGTLAIATIARIVFAGGEVTLDELRTSALAMPLFPLDILPTRDRDTCERMIRNNCHIETVRIALLKSIGRW